MSNDKIKYFYIFLDTQKRKTARQKKISTNKQESHNNNTKIMSIPEMYIYIRSYFTII